ncbi:MAG: plastocyanin/azurin family copper-binding protein [Candidatus Zixiibacteriota bacterium]
MRPALRFALSSMTLLTLTVPGYATIHDINMSGFSFSPIGTVVNYGDTVRWHVVSGIHTSTSDVGSPKSWNSGSMATVGQTFDVAFVLADGPGPFPYHCTPHVSFGMVDTIKVSTGPCCTGITGNVDGDSGDIVDISDLSAMVDFLFFGGSISACFEENDVDISASVDISDLQALIDFLFFSAALPNCP